MLGYPGKELEIALMVVAVLALLHLSLRIGVDLMCGGHTVQTTLKVANV